MALAPSNSTTRLLGPLLFSSTNYNIPPKERFQKKHIISLGTIPGPKKPADMDSFLWLVVQEPLQLEIGVSSFDPIAQVNFFSFISILLLSTDHDHELYRLFLSYMLT